jgi:chromosome partitioning protein
MLTLNLWQPKPAAPPAMAVARAEPQRPLLRIVVLNTKGGCGKTTLSTNLAGYYAARGFRTALLDADPQGSGLRWLSKRGEGHAAIHGMSGCDKSGRVTRSFQLRIPQDTERLVVDTPAALDSLRLQDLTRGAHAILIPVLPSDIDIHAASRCIAELLLAARIDDRTERVAVVANRVKKHTRVYATLRRFLDSLDIPFVASLRDTQNYIHAVEQGLSIHELESHNVKQDRYEWAALIEWLESRTPDGARHITQVSASDISVR